MSKIKLSRTLLSEEIPKIDEQIVWANANMLKCKIGTPQRQKWFDLAQHLRLTVLEMKVEKILTTKKKAGHNTRLFQPIKADKYI